ncbi:helix-turn-helix domain-containing protein [Clostridium sp.]|uniref:helix-turn-helix transcriptional regulator n=1 Tax=Clostridium sp. TaxID=1506 RepID=UPI00258E13A9|nr:helix-turn-helix domain-containing protein [Clostridium sp.]MDF2502783.1 DNA-binding phage protein [Clostridium sp.]
MISKNLKALRELKGINQTKTAKHLGISLHSYCNKENGKSDFSLDEAKKLSELFGLTVDEIFFKPLDFKMNTGTSI